MGDAMDEGDEGYDNGEHDEILQVELYREREAGAFDLLFGYAYLFGIWCIKECEIRGLDTSKRVALKPLFGKLVQGTPGVEVDDLIVLCARTFAEKDKAAVFLPDELAVLRNIVFLPEEWPERRLKPEERPYETGMRVPGTVRCCVATRTLVLCETYLYGMLWPERRDDLSKDAALTDTTRGNGAIRANIKRWLDRLVENLRSSAVEAAKTDLFSRLNTPVAVALRSSKTGYERYRDTVYTNHHLASEEDFKYFQSAGRVGIRALPEDVLRNPEMSMGDPKIINSTIVATLFTLFASSYPDWTPKKFRVCTSAEATPQDWCPPWSIHLADDGAWINVGVAVTEEIKPEHDVIRPRWKEIVEMPTALYCIPGTAPECAPDGIEIVYGLISQLYKAMPWNRRLKEALYFFLHGVDAVFDENTHRALDKETIELMALIS